LGARTAIGIDVEPEYIALGRHFFEKTSPEKIHILPCQDGMIPIQSETVDFVLMNEVISHINPGHLDIVLQDISRILRIGGILFISDGNNIANQKRRRKLFDLWDKWENGPDGVKADKDVVNKCYLTRRKEIILSRYPELDDERVNLLALNTSGLWGDLFLRVIDEFVSSGNLIRRTYRRGICPTNPSNTGVVIERGFYPLQVSLSLRNYGIEAHQLPPKLFTEGKNIEIKLKALCLVIGNCLLPGWYKRFLGSFNMIGIKKW
jgi:SAM-dependent methyltransferase